jgi:hypothetical protein
MSASRDCQSRTLRSGALNGRDHIIDCARLNLPRDARAVVRGVGVIHPDWNGFHGCRWYEHGSGMQYQAKK